MALDLDQVGKSELLSTSYVCNGGGSIIGLRHIGESNDKMLFIIRRLKKSKIFEVT